MSMRLPSPNWHTQTSAPAIRRVLNHFSDSANTRAWDMAWRCLFDPVFREAHTESYNHAQTARTDLHWLANWDALSEMIKVLGPQKLDAILPRRAVLALITWPEEGAALMERTPAEVKATDSHAARLLYPAVVALNAGSAK